METLLVNVVYGISMKIFILLLLKFIFQRSLRLSTKSSALIPDLRKKLIRCIYALLAKFIVNFVSAH